MQKTFLQLMGLLCLSLIFTSGATKKSVANYQVIPLPNEIIAHKSQYFTLDKSVKIVYPAGNEKMLKNADFLSQYIKDQCGIETYTTTDSKTKKAIVLRLDLKEAAPEAYRIVVNAQQIIVSAASENGIFYGIQTLRKSIPTEKSTTVEFPAATVNDAPRFPYRGMHLDVVRHFFSVDEVKTYIDILALHNVNTFHWHLTDDQGWRIEIKKYPLLTEIGSKRTETVIGRNTGVYDGIPYGGFYTQDECREIVAYAADRYINIIPEIDMPGHMLGALEAYPELGCTGGPYQVWRIWGISEDVLCVGNDKTLKFIEDVLTELIDVFPSKYIHIGGDECPKTSWKKCPKCQARITSLGLVTDEHHTAEERLQSYFMAYAEKLLNDKGRKIIGWDEILEGGIAPNATVMSWRSMEGGIEAAKLHHDVIMTPNSHLYFDHYQSIDTELEPYAIGGYSSVRKVYEWDPLPASLTNEEQKHILGAQANVWTEYIATFKHVQYMVLPRLAALCEVQWSKPEQKNYFNFLKRIPNLVGIYKLNNYNYARHLFDVSADFTSNPKDRSVDVKLLTLDKAPIHYTLDGSEPTPSSAVYSDILKIKQNAQLRAVVFRGQEASRILKDEILFSKSTLKPIKALQPLNEKYMFNGITTLVDGLHGNKNYKTGRWIAVYGNDMNALIDLEKSTTIQEVAISVCVDKGAWVFDARSLSIETSVDGVTYKRVAMENYPPMKKDDANGVIAHKLSFSPVEARYVKVMIGSEQFLPDWHSGKGSKGFLFVDEITIN